MSRSKSFVTTPRGGMGKREPQTILKTDERKLVRNSASKANSLRNQWAGTKNGVFLEGDRLEIELKGGRWVLTHLPAKPPRQSRCCTTSRTTE
jgi:hypothetical protein